MTRVGGVLGAADAGLGPQQRELLEAMAGRGWMTAKSASIVTSRLDEAGWTTKRTRRALDRLAERGLVEVRYERDGEAWYRVRTDRTRP